MLGAVTISIPVPAAALETGVSEKTLRREIAAGRLPIVRIRSRVLVLRSDLAAYLAANRRACPSAATAEPTRPAFNPPGSGLAALLHLDKTRLSGSAGHGRGSKIVALDERRPTRSKRPSSAG